ncbi:macrolide 2'-phosphotransferase [Paenibacillus mucilaginosus]|uniref:Aminoglycoside phosphotransferase n=1 Tax=Paenibacillus mucilaginosus (strain KNP414) TaxID=1036673 RepID=F8F9J1_PAEMK|nr:macrolide 2'-phosphotransferase [Paenibacillus mucilaginosus]AEI43680.1 aminoglycoside phosphotransferase [Paenibacillus mucilaginosus KNP414]MCG7216919.1 macrolide 2'-phosphotransferase [Paenibacillus mucilaginosus]WDM25204.1 macrolide 2'-phosphotransferase [Paenibacillus mucilaginosus]
MTALNTNGQEPKQHVEEVLAAASRHGLQLDPGSVELNESGMDFRVAFASDDAGARWVLRQPRREDVWERAENERKVLGFLQGKVPVEVPDWRIFTPELIAYPLLGGHPVAAVDPAGGGYAWRCEQASLPELFFDSLAQTLAALHAVDHEEAAAAGVRVKRPQEAREAFADNIEEIRRSFEIPEPLAERWNAWLAADSYWPEHSTLNHGDLHPPHIIVDEMQRVTGLIDWTEAECGDPGKDFVIFFALFGEEGLRDLLRRYERLGGRVWPRMPQHIAEQWAAYPALVAKFALTTGREADMEMARGMIAHWQTG